MAGNDCGVISRLRALWKTDFSDVFLFSYKQRTVVHFLVNWSVHNKKMTEKSVFRDAWSPEMMSQSFPVSCFWFHGFVPHQKWNLTLLVHQNTGKENFSLLYIPVSVHGGDLIKQIKQICRIHFKRTFLQSWTLLSYSVVLKPEWSGSWSGPQNNSVFSLGDSEASETLDKCLECMHAEEICVIPYKYERFDQEFSVASERDLTCEVELICFCKVCLVMVL